MSHPKNTNSNNSPNNTNTSDKSQSDGYSCIEYSGGDGGNKIREEDGWLQCSIYVSTSSPEVFEDIHKSVNRILDSVDLKAEKYGLIRKGSWYQDFKVKLSKVTRRLLAQRLKEVEHSVKLHTTEMAEARIVRDSADGVSSLISSLSGTDNAVIRLGYVIVIKVTTNGSSTISSFNLTKEQNEYAYKNPDIFREPQLLFEYLSNNKKYDTETSIGDGVITVKNQR